jgi:hypothetical protein
VPARYCPTWSDGKTSNFGLKSFELPLVGFDPNTAPDDVSAAIWCTSTPLGRFLNSISAALESNIFP